jgi:hypothetical protein
MYQIRFSYHYGIVEYRVVIIDEIEILQKPIVCHRLWSTTETVIGDVDQPIRAHIENGDSTPAQSFTMNVRGRFCSNLGIHNPPTRITSERRLSIATSTTFIPTVSFQRQATFPTGSSRANSINVSVNGLDIITSDDLVWQLRLNSTLTGASFNSPSETPSTETCVLSDVAATVVNMSTGVNLVGGLAAGTDKVSTLTTALLDMVLPGTQPVTLCVRNITGSGSVSVLLRVQEEW